MGLVAAMLAFALLPAARASAAPEEPAFGPMIEGPAGYDGQATCSPSAKPGVTAFGNLLRAAYPSTSWIGIGRACDVGGTSEHKEGRALDWSRNASSRGERKDAEDVIGWLLETDRFGNEAAMARRLGVMYIVWNRRIWGSWDNEWEVYCVQKGAVCKDPDGGYALHPHTDHVHFSFSWAGARKKTSFWNADRTFVAAAAPSAEGYVMLGGGGGVIARGAPDHGSKASSGFRKTYVDIAATADGRGYWLVTDAGVVAAFGDVSQRGRAEGSAIVAIAATPTGRGYWLAGDDGQVFAFGDAPQLGGLDAQAQVVDLVATTTGLGYWIVTADGGVIPFGDALPLGDLAEGSGAVSIAAAAPSGPLGVLLVSGDGRVFALGDAEARGELRKTGASPVVDIVGTSSGQGYWLIRANGTARAFGDA